MVNYPLAIKKAVKCQNGSYKAIECVLKTLLFFIRINNNLLNQKLNLH